MFSVSQVKPSPSGVISTPSCRAATCSPYSVAALLMNCSIATRIPRPDARSRMPSAAVVLPFPSPVLTMSSPRRDSRGGTRYGPGCFFFGVGGFRPDAVGGGVAGGAVGSTRSDIVVTGRGHGEQHVEESIVVFRGA